jgi:hypothetical protein
MNPVTHFSSSSQSIFRPTPSNLKLLLLWRLSISSPNLLEILLSFLFKVSKIDLLEESLRWRAHYRRNRGGSLRSEKVLNRWMVCRNWKALFLMLMGLCGEIFLVWCFKAMFSILSRVAMWFCVFVASALSGEFEDIVGWDYDLPFEKLVLLHGLSFLS